MGMTECLFGSAQIVTQCGTDSLVKGQEGGDMNGMVHYWSDFRCGHWVSYREFLEQP